MRPRTRHSFPLYRPSRTYGTLTDRIRRSLARLLIRFFSSLLALQKRVRPPTFPLCGRSFHSAASKLPLAGRTGRRAIRRSVLGPRVRIQARNSENSFHARTRAAPFLGSGPRIAFRARPTRAAIRRQSSHRGHFDADAPGRQTPNTCGGNDPGGHRNQLTSTAASERYVNFSMSCELRSSNYSRDKLFGYW